MKTGNFRSRGISLIEVMMVFAVTSLLVAFSLPAYVDRAIKVRVDEDLRQVSLAQNALLETCARDASATVTNNQETEYFYPPVDAEKGFINEILLVADCATKSMTIMVWTRLPGGAADSILEWSASTQGSETSWACRIIRGDVEKILGDCSTG